MKPLEQNPYYEEPPPLNKNKTTLNPDYQDSMARVRVESGALSTVRIAQSGMPPKFE